MARLRQIIDAICMALLAILYCAISAVLALIFAIFCAIAYVNLGIWGIYERLQKGSGNE